MTEPPRSTLAAALAYAAAGWPVLPVAASAKLPLPRHGVHDVSVDAAQIRRWWRRWPDAGVGIATGARSGLAVVDVDVKADGRASLAGLRAGRGSLPFTMLAYTGGGGFHLYYRQPPGLRVPNTVGRLPNVEGPLPGIDLRGDGGYVVAPPTVHASGRPYRWASRQPDEPAPLPRWLWPPPPRPPAAGPPGIPRRSGASLYGMAALGAETDAVRRLVEGQRNHGLNRAAFCLGTLVAGGELAEDLVHRELLAAALAVGLGEQEADRTICSGLGASAGSPRRAPERGRVPAR
ncbi:MAG TPA: bifunctional DNA primase/polymerase [Acidimicrobiales bacterium]|nr:bifunctional DNA primase/polymerase [Acidimicrobiales bacterium]